MKHSRKNSGYISSDHSSPKAKYSSQIDFSTNCFNLPPIRGVDYIDSEEYSPSDKENIDTSTPSNNPLIIGIFYAAKHNNIEILQSVLRDNQNRHINAQGSKGETALHFAAYYDNEEAVRILLANGANPNIPDNNGDTALHFAASTGNLAITTMLIEYEANVYIINNIGQTAQDTAFETSYDVFYVFQNSLDLTGYIANYIREFPKFFLKKLHLNNIFTEEDFITANNELFGNDALPPLVGDNLDVPPLMGILFSPLES